MLREIRIRIPEYEHGLCSLNCPLLRVCVWELANSGIDGPGPECPGPGKYVLILKKDYLDD